MEKTYVVFGIYGIGNDVHLYEPTKQTKYHGKEKIFRDYYETEQEAIDAIEKHGKAGNDYVVMPVYRKSININ